MARWSIATWRGNGQNQGPSMVEVRGLVLHIAVGWYEGTISWQRNPDSRVSSHFVVGREQGELAQMVDTSVRAWTQGDGNGRWLSSENEGFLAGDRRNPGGWERLSPWQIEANAQLLAQAHRKHGVPLRIADHPGELGLGHHSMDREWLDEMWGHDQCPGAAIVAQKPLIVARAKQIVEGDDVSAAEVWDYPTKNVRQGKDSDTLQLLRYANEYGYRAWRAAVAAAANGKAVLAHLAGEDVAAAAEAGARQGARAELAELGPALAEQLRAELADVPAEQVTAAVDRGLRAVLGSLDDST